jgi:hypothetical protein
MPRSRLGASLEIRLGFGSAAIARPILIDILAEAAGRNAEPQR